MKAIIKPSRDVGFELANVPLPTIGSQDVLIKIKAASICGSDLPIFDWDETWVRKTIQPGQIVGHEFCGVVVERGKNVETVELGELVTAEGHLNCRVCPRCQNGEGHVCPNLKLVGFDHPGAFAEYIAVPESNIIHLKGLPLVIAAIQDPFGNAVHAVTKVALPNTSVLVTGCGPVGLMIVGLAKLLGACQIFATDISQYRLDLAVKMGADYALNPKKDDVDSIITKETGADLGVDILFEASGSPQAFMQGFRLLRNAGVSVLLGLAKQPILFDFANGMIVRGITTYGIVGRIMYRTWDQASKFLDVKRNLRTIDLFPIITHRLLFEDFKEGINLMRSGLCGKVILFPDKKSLDESLSNSNIESFDESPNLPDKFNGRLQ